MVGPTSPPSKPASRPAAASKMMLYGGLTVLVVAAVGFGLSLRLQDPTSSEVVPAEDPYTHMALVREHLRDGNLDPLNEPGTLYPPGMHALLAAVVVYTGADLYDLTRLAPSFFGAIGLVGLAVLVARFESLGAALAAVLTLAIIPEAIFRTTMLSPTALDLALLPFLAFAVLELLQGKLAWAGAAAPLAAFLLFSHPWVYGILGVAGLALLLLVTLMPWPASRGFLPTAWGVVATVAIIGSCLALSLSGCWGGCGPGFRDVLGPEQSGLMDTLAATVLLGALLPLGIKAVYPRAFRDLFPTQRPPASFAVRLVLGQAMLVAVVVTYIYAKAQGWPPEVDPMVMFGWPVLVLAALGLAALPFRPTPGGHLGAALALGTFPFVVFDPFHSPFWSHRTAVYLAIGIAILVGVALISLVHAAIAVARRLPTPGAETGQRNAGTMAALGVTGLLVLVALAGGAYAATPGQYKGGWYRLYEDCEFDGLREMSDLANDDPRALVVTGTWQSKLVLASITEDATRLWYKPDFFTSDVERANVIRMQEEQGRPIVVLVDSKLAAEHPEIDPSFLESEPWTPVGEWCTTDGGASLRAYTVSR